jgi:hypothetical protein
MRKHQRLNSYNTERANRKATRKAQETPIVRTLKNDFWGEYYRLSSERVTDKTPRFEPGTLTEIAYRLALTEQMVIDLMTYMRFDGITHRDPQGEYISSILSDAQRVTA